MGSREAMNAMLDDIDERIVRYAGEKRPTKEEIAHLSPEDRLVINIAWDCYERMAAERKIRRMFCLQVCLIGVALAIPPAAALIWKLFQ